MQNHPYLPAGNAPYSLIRRSERNRRRQMLREPHAVELAMFSQEIRDAVGNDDAVPDFDPVLGGTRARILLLLEAPGSEAIKSGFVSLHNPDKSAAMLHYAVAESEIPYENLAIWNAIPWHYGISQGTLSGGLASLATASRPPKRKVAADIEHWLSRLIGTLPDLREIIAVGGEARSLLSKSQGVLPSSVVLTSATHPSPRATQGSKISSPAALSLIQSLKDAASRLPL